MGSTELNLLLKFGVPLAVRLLADGEDEKETIVTVTSAITGMASRVDVGEALLEADEQQTKSIIDSLFGVIVGIGDAFGGLIKAIAGLLGG